MQSIDNLMEHDKDIGLAIASREIIRLTDAEFDNYLNLIRQLESAPISRRYFVAFHQETLGILNSKGIKVKNPLSTRFLYFDKNNYLGTALFIKYTKELVSDSMLVSLIDVKNDERNVKMTLARVRGHLTREQSERETIDSAISRGAFFAAGISDQSPSRYSFNLIKGMFRYEPQRLTIENSEGIQHWTYKY